MPSIAYIGQKFTRLVAMNIPAAINATIPNVPEITFAKNKMISKAATVKRINLSLLPMFFFISFIVKLNLTQS